MIAERTNAFVHYEEIGSDADKRDYIVSYEKINKLGFKTTITIEEGIDEIVRALKIVDFQDPYTNAKNILR